MVKVTPATSTVAAIHELLRATGDSPGSPGSGARTRRTLRPARGRRRSQVYRFDPVALTMTIVAPLPSIGAAFGRDEAVRGVRWSAVRQRGLDVSGRPPIFVGHVYRIDPGLTRRRCWRPRSTVHGSGARARAGRAHLHRWIVRRDRRPRTVGRSHQRCGAAAVRAAGARPRRYRRGAGRQPARHRAKRRRAGPVPLLGDHPRFRARRGVAR